MRHFTAPVPEQKIGNTHLRSGSLKRMRKDNTISGLHIVINDDHFLASPTIDELVRALKTALQSCSTSQPKLWRNDQCGWAVVRVGGVGEWMGECMCVCEGEGGERVSGEGKCVGWVRGWGG